MCWAKVEALSVRFIEFGQVFDFYHLNLDYYQLLDNFDFFG